MFKNLMNNEILQSVQWYVKKIIQERKMWKLLKLVVFLSLPINAGPQVSIELTTKNYENRSYMVQKYSQPINQAYKEMSDEEYKLVVDLIFENMDIFFRINLFQENHHYRALKLGVDILNLYTQTGNDKALSILRTLMVRDKGKLKIDHSCHGLEDLPFQGVQTGDSWNDPNISEVRSYLINKYPEINSVIEELIPQNAFNRIINYVGSWFSSNAPKETNSVKTNSRESVVLLKQCVTELEQLIGANSEFSNELKKLAKKFEYTIKELRKMELALDIREHEIAKGQYLQTKQKEIIREQLLNAEEERIKINQKEIELDEMEFDLDKREMEIENKKNPQRLSFYDSVSYDERKPINKLINNQNSENAIIDLQKFARKLSEFGAKFASFGTKLDHLMSDELKKFRENKNDQEKREAYMNRGNFYYKLHVRPGQEALNQEMELNTKKKTSEIKQREGMLNKRKTDLENEEKKQNLILSLAKEQFDQISKIDQRLAHLNEREAHVRKRELDLLAKEEQQNRGLDFSFAEKLAQQSKQLEEFALIKQQMDEKNEELNILKENFLLAKINAKEKARQVSEYQEKINTQKKELDSLRTSDLEKDIKIEQMKEKLIEIKQGIRDEIERSLGQKNQELDSLRTSNLEKDETIRQMRLQYDNCLGESLIPSAIRNVQDQNWVSNWVSKFESGDLDLQNIQLFEILNREFILHQEQLEALPLKRFDKISQDPPTRPSSCNTSPSAVLYQGLEALARKDIYGMKSNSRSETPISRAPWLPYSTKSNLQPEVPGIRVGNSSEEPSTVPSYSYNSSQNTELYALQKDNMEKEETIKQLHAKVNDLLTQLRKQREELDALKNRNSARSSSTQPIFTSSFKGFLDQQTSDRSEAPRRNIRSTSQFASEKDQKRAWLQKQGGVSPQNVTAFNHFNMHTIHRKVSEGSIESEGSLLTESIGSVKNNTPSNMQHRGDPTLAMKFNRDSQTPDISSSEMHPNQVSEVSPTRSSVMRSSETPITPLLGTYSGPPTARASSLQSPANLVYRGSMEVHQGFFSNSQPAINSIARSERSHQNYTPTTQGGGRISADSSVGYNLLSVRTPVSNSSLSQMPVTPVGNSSGPSTAPASYNQNGLMMPRSALPLGQTDSYTPRELPSRDYSLVENDSSSDDE